MSDLYDTALIILPDGRKLTITELLQQRADLLAVLERLMADTVFGCPAWEFSTEDGLDNCPYCNDYRHSFRRRHAANCPIPAAYAAIGRAKGEAS